MLATLCPLTVAGSTFAAGSTTVFANVGIRRVVGMALRAMRLVLVHWGQIQSYAPLTDALSLVRIVACPTHPTPGQLIPCRATDQHRILRRERMAAGADRLAGIDHYGGVAPQYVLALRNWLQMVRIDAVSHPAEVIQHKASRDRASEQQPGYSMCCSSAPLPASFPIVAPYKSTATPEPTGSGLLNLSPEAISRGDRVAAVRAEGADILGVHPDLLSRGATGRAVSAAPPSLRAQYDSSFGVTTPLIRRGGPPAEDG